MIKPDILIRTNRRSLSITISKNAEVIVRAPKKLSMDYILKFLQEKEKWIKSKREEILATRTANNSIINYESFLLFGVKYNRVEQDGIKDIEVTKSNIYFPKCKTKEQMMKIAQNFYIKTSLELLKQRVEYFADLMQLNYNKIIINNSKSKWGMCMSSRVLKFNFRLSMLPPKVIDYIIIHELSHLIEFNHSPKFYKIVESVMPDYKRHRQELKKYNYILNLFR